MLKVTYTWGNTTASRKMTRTKRYNEKPWLAGRHQKNHQYIFKSNHAICLKIQVYISRMLRAMTYGAECRTLTKQAHKKLRPHIPTWHPQNHIQGQKDKCLGQGENKRHINGKNEVVLGNAHPPPERLSMGIACHHLETIRQETLTR